MSEYYIKKLVGKSSGRVPDCALLQKKLICFYFEHTREHETETILLQCAISFTHLVGSTNRPRPLHYRQYTAIKKKTLGYAHKKIKLSYWSALA